MIIGFVPVKFSICSLFFKKSNAVSIFYTKVRIECFMRTLLLYELSRWKFALLLHFHLEKFV